MPIIEQVTYKPSWILRNGHLNTLYPYFFRKKPKLHFERERYFTPDSDFFDVDWIKNHQRKLVILMHGLEGSSSSQYILGNAKYFSQHQYDVAAINFRSCSGEMNHQVTMYHSGFTSDLHQFITENEKNYDSIYILGFSLGGNVTFKYLCDQNFSISPKIKAGAGVSVPCDLMAGSYTIAEKKNHFYEKNFVDTLLKKVIEKQILHPNAIDLTHVKTTKTIREFDHNFTAPIHGFNSADDYYAKCNCKQFLGNLSIPGLMINALDDSFLPDESYPYEEAMANENLYFMAPKHGGHVGFATLGAQQYWIEKEVFRFFEIHG